jgi:hypothetical protein
MSTYEHVPSHEKDRDCIEIRSIFDAFLYPCLMRFGYQEINDELASDIEFINAGNTHFFNGKEIDLQDINAIAAASILKQLYETILKGRPVELTVTVPRMKDLFNQVQTQFNTLGLNDPNALPDGSIILEATQALTHKQSSPNPRIQAAVEVFDARGTVEIEMEHIGDLQESLALLDTTSTAPDAIYIDNGMLIEERTLPPAKQTYTKEVPFYFQFSEVHQGTVWLESLLEDLVAIHARM